MHMNQINNHLPPTHNRNNRSFFEIQQWTYQDLKIIRSGLLIWNSHPSSFPQILTITRQVHWTRGGIHGYLSRNKRNPQLLQSRGRERDCALVKREGATIDQNSRACDHENSKSSCGISMLQGQIWLLGEKGAHPASSLARSKGTERWTSRKKGGWLPDRSLEDSAKASQKTEKGITSVRSGP